MTIHKPVLLEETIDGLGLKPGAVVVDATLGGGGHSLEILEKIGKDGKLIAIDIDEKAIEKFKEKIGSRKQVILARGNFSELESILGGLGVKTADAVLADLGYSSDQLEDPERGMSFLKDAPLDMRLNQEGELTAEKIVNGYSQKELTDILKIYGEERFARNIARKIIEYRKNKKIETTLELARIVESAVGERYRHGRIHPATRTFQALRIKTNRELENLEKFIPQAVEILSQGGRLGIISFHSLEDRIVKNIFRENARGCICPKNFPECRCAHEAKVKVVTRKPMIPGNQEIAENPRARSAKLRISEKI